MEAAGVEGMNMAEEAAMEVEKGEVGVMDTGIKAVVVVEVGMEVAVMNMVVVVVEKEEEDVKSMVVVVEEATVEEQEEEDVKSMAMVAAETNTAASKVNTAAVVPITRAEKEDTAAAVVKVPLAALWRTRRCTPKVPGIRACSKTRWVIYSRITTRTGIRTLMRARR